MLIRVDGEFLVNFGWFSIPVYCSNEFKSEFERERTLYVQVQRVGEDALRKELARGDVARGAEEAVAVVRRIEEQLGGHLVSVER